MKVIRNIFIVLVTVALLAGAGLGVMYIFSDHDSSPISTRKDATQTGQRSSETGQPSPTPGITYSIEETKRAQARMIPNKDISEIANDVLPSVVQITSKVLVRDMFGFGYQGESRGSGIIISEDEHCVYIATNNHVIENASAVSVILPDNTEITAEVKGTSPYDDLAILTIEASALSEDTRKSFKVAKLAEENAYRVGEMVLAVGNAEGYGTSVTVGYISAVNRVITTEDGVSMTVIQTDAAINPGNSGGALVNINGEVIGINSAKAVDVDVEGMGYAIPIAQATPILNELKTIEQFDASEAGCLGVYILPVTDEMISSFGWPSGVYVKEVIDNSAAKQAGILAGDIITAVNGMKVATTEQLTSRISSYRAGTTVTLTVFRNKDGQQVSLAVEVTLMDKSSMPEN